MTGKVVALNRFVSRATNKCMPFFKVLKIGTALPASKKEKMISFLRANQDVFAWKHKDMPGIDRKIIQHRLNVNPECKPV